MSIKSAETVTRLFTVSDPATSGAVDADSTPTGTLHVNGTANGATVTVTKLATGRYKAAVTLPALTVGDECDLLVSAAVGGVTGEAVVWADTCDHAQDDVLTPLATVDGNVDSIKATVEHATHGLAAMHTILTTTGVMLDDTEAAALAALVESYLVNETDATALMQAIVDKFAAAYPDLDDVTLAAMAAAVWANSTRSLTDKAGFSLATGHGLATEAKQDVAQTDLDTLTAQDAPLDATATQTAAQAALTAQGGTPERFAALDYLDAPVSEAGGGEVDDGVEITQDSLGTDGEELGRVQPNAKVTVYLGGEAQYQFDADADGDYSYKLPEGSTWTLRAVAPRYTDIILEVAT